ncbi:MAG: hypothetical protein HYX73_04990 [Acidobacteria bacterium]|nr:hypothetical protein [Acidobacteriota bacterium]
MNATEVIEREPKREGCFQVGPLLAECIGQSRHASHAHSDRKVLAFNMRSANAVHIGKPKDWVWVSADYFGRGVPLFAFPRRSIGFDKLPVVNTTADKVVVNRSDVALEAVSGKLVGFLRSSVRQLANENVSVSSGALAKMPRKNQLRGALKPDEAVGVTKVLTMCFICPLVGLFLPDESPNFVALNVFDGYVLDAVSHQSFALATDDGEQCQDCGVVNASDPLSAANGTSFQEKLKDLSSTVYGRIHPVQRIGAFFCEGFLTGFAVESLKSVAMLSELFALRVAVVARHREPCLSLASGSHWSCLGPGEQSPGFDSPGRSSQLLSGFFLCSAWLNNTTSLAVLSSKIVRLRTVFMGGASLAAWVRINLTWFQFPYIMSLGSGRLPRLKSPKNLWRFKGDFGRSVLKDANNYPVTLRNGHQEAHFAPPLSPKTNWKPRPEPPGFSYWSVACRRPARNIPFPIRDLEP